MLVSALFCLVQEQADYTEKSMFEASMIRSAKKLSATFIQCRQWFHTVPMIALECKSITLRTEA
jgi:hypothetical protein